MKLSPLVRGVGIVGVAALAAGACADQRADSRTKPAAPPPPSITTVAKRQLGPVPLVRDECFATDTTETAAMKCAAGAASRIADTLQILLASGPVVRRVDRPQDDESRVIFRYAGRIGGSSGSPAFHVLDVRGYESGWVEMINALTGDVLHVASRPVISPDGARFSVDDMGGFESCEGMTVLQVWRITGDKPVSELDLQPFDCGTNKGWGPSKLEWRSRDTISFLRNTLPRDSTRLANQETDTTRAVLVHRAEGWILDP